MCRPSEFPPYEDVPAFERMPNVEDTEAMKDVWGKPIVSQFDGHSAWSCNDRLCVHHPASLYGDTSWT